MIGPKDSDVISLGAKDGVRAGQRIYGFVYDDVRRRRDGYELHGKRGIAELEVVSVGEFGSWVLVRRGSVTERTKLTTERIALRGR